MNRTIELEALPKAAESFIRGARPGGQISAAGVRRLLKGALRTVKHYKSSSGAASEWILDNRYLIENSALTALLELRTMRRLTADGRLPLMYTASRLLVELGGGKCDRGRAEVFFDAAAGRTPLSCEDLAAAVPMLRAATVCLIAEAAESGGDAGFIGQLVTTLRNINEPGFYECFSRIDRAERILSEDPAGIYPHMDDDTRAMYRQRLGRIAARRGISDESAASVMLNDAKKRNVHIGEVLFESRKLRRRADSRGRLYITAVMLTSFVAALFAAYGLKSAWAGLLLLLPVSEAVKNTIDIIVLRLVKPQKLPRMDYSENGIPEDGRTLVAISVLLTDEKTAKRCVRNMEEYCLASRDAGKNLYFALLADLPESDTPTRPEDRGILAAAAKEVDRLNHRYGGRFCLLARRRTWSEGSRCYMGHERKRGAIGELVSLLRGKESGLRLSGDESAVKNIKYILALDSDTRLTPGAARKMVEAAMHPMLRPNISKDGRSVVSGCGVIAPRISVSLDAAGKSPFTRILAGRGGCDPYGGVCSDLYQDLLASAAFCGKGLIDVDCYDAVLTGRFPKERILSHDLLEGAYLGCAYAGDVELTDGFPKSAVSFFKRQHRWVRGDWQIAAWLGTHVPTEDGRDENPLKDGDKWKILDNLRRSLVPVAAFASIMLGLNSSRRDLWITSLLSLAAYFSGSLLSAAMEAAHYTFNRGRLRPESREILPLRLAAMLLRFALLPFEAWINLSAIVTALYRILISKRGLLDWVTAAQTEGGKGGSSDFFALWPCLVSGAVAVVTSIDAAGYIAAALWLSAPFALSYLMKAYPGVKPLSTEDRVYLMDACRAAYTYFSDTGAVDHYLPPDNRQIRPALGAAHRTSPTNIGLALMSHLAAADMELASRDEAVRSIERIISTVERLPCWRGHLYNWYDTRTLRVIGGGFVSTVDSGNFVASLMTVAVGLEELGENDLARRALKIAMGADFRPLYDRHARLFYTGWDTVSDRPTGSRYDLLESEARLTSYIAVAMGQVPREHWQSLGRVLTAGHGVSGLASWTGTMFEYFMPHLWLPAPKGSMLHEALRFCVHEQRRARKPWGESESAFFAVDNSLAYCYKAHGIASLALRRGMEQDSVVSPYSSFLALPVAGHYAVDNLRQLENMGLTGKYGFYEAVDFTASRTAGKDSQIVATFMAHHIGMSIVAADNALLGDKMVRRFMSIPQMAAMRPLLEEKTPDGAVLLSRRPGEIPARSEHRPASSWSVSARDIDPLAPRSVILSNGAYSLLITDTGLSRSKCAQTELTRFMPGTDEGYGLAAAVRMAGELLPITPAPWFDPKTRYGFDANLNAAGISARKDGLAAAMTCQVPEYETGEIRRFPVLSRSDGKAELILLLHPVLCASADYEAHPAFNRLMLDYEIKGNMISVRRRGGGGKHEKWLTIALNAPAVFSTDWEGSVGRSYMPAFTLPPSPEKGPIPAGGVIISVSMDLKAGVKSEVKFAMALADHRDDSESAAKHILEGKAGDCGRFAAERIARCGLDDSAVTEAMELVSALEFHLPSENSRSTGLSNANAAPSELWKAGISGDLPIDAKEGGGDPEAAFNRPAAIHTFLTAMGERYDLALITDDGGEYLRPAATAARSVLRRLDALHMLGMPGGVHIVDRASGSAEAVLAASVNRDILRMPGRAVLGKSLAENPRRLYPNFQYGVHDEYSTEFSGILPPKAYSHVIAGESFGFIATESGSGNMWCRNANLGRVTPWSNERCAAEGPERLFMISNGNKISLFAADDGYPCRFTCGLGYSRWEKEIGGIKTSVTAFIPWNEPVRLLRISVKGTDSAEIEYCARLASGERNSGSLRTKSEFRNGLFRFSAPVGGEGVSFAASGELTAFTCDWNEYLTGSFGGTSGLGMEPCCAMRFVLHNEAVIAAAGAGTKTAKNYISPDTADKLFGESEERWREVTSSKLRLESGIEKLDHYMNGWALYQVMASRMLARAGFDQCGGAYGFRDQLQDCRALMYTAPEYARSHILRSASRQYSEGDVQHWWHPGDDGGRGVRTRCSDDLLWLPFVLSEYVDVTDDEGICFENVPWLISPLLGDDEPERYEHAETSGDTASVIDHAIKAINLVISRGTQSGGLLKIGGGDWNDGMTLPPDSGSLWLTAFAAVTAQRTAALCRKLGRAEDAGRLDSFARAWSDAVKGAMTELGFPRALLPDGRVIGSGKSQECAVDSISQSWAQLCGVTGEKTREALKYAFEQLDMDGVYALFTPPFDGAMTDPGYIARYAPGFRENGGQYTHGAIWLAAALLDAGLTKEGMQLMLSILPEDKEPSFYRGEPFVLPGDVSTNKFMPGRVGWTWYTGSAAWFFTETLTRILGIKVKKGRLFIDQAEVKLPDGYKADFLGHRIEAERTENGCIRVTVDQNDPPKEGIPL